MSTNFIHENFLLENKYAEELYHKYSKNQPIIDYHNHLSPKLIAEDNVFKNITDVWINGDHYKWRAMRTLGVNEKFITGDASDKEKFLQWGKTVPYTLRNPLYHWTHLELARYFNIYDLLNEQKKKGVAVIYVGEDLDVLLALSDRILVLCGGKENGILDARKTTKEEVGLLMTNLQNGGADNE
jgi:hypothetical protein